MGIASAYPLFSGSWTPLILPTVMERPMPFFPIELVLHTIACGLPALGTILSPRHSATKTLLAFTLVCHETKRPADRYLRQYCVYLDSADRLRSYLLAIPIRTELRAVTSLCLAPFDDDIDDLPLCCWVRELLNYTCETLKKLVIDMPLRTCYPEDDHLAVRPVLREGFARLVNLEEFVSTRDELYLDVTDREDAVVWRSWPKLRRLGLWNVDANADFWRHVALHTTLETVVLSNPDSLDQFDPKAEYCKHTTRSLRLIIFTHQGLHARHPEYDVDGTKWKRLDPGNRVTIIACQLAAIGDDSLLNPCQEEIRAAAENNSLWSSDGNVIRSPAQLSFII